MILFLGDSFTWGQGLYFEKWKSEGIDVMRWKKQYGEIHDYPHEHLGYESHKYRKENHFPALVSKHFNKDYNVKWGNGGSNWDIIHQVNLIPALSPQYRNGLELVVVQFTDWTRTDNRILYHNDIYEQTPIPNIDYIHKDKNWQDKLVDKLMEDEKIYQIKKIKDTLDELNIKWIGISWLNDMGKLLKEHFPENYVPFYYNNKEYVGFEIGLKSDEYSLKEFDDGHFNSNGCRLVADSIIKKINDSGLSDNFTHFDINKNII